MNILSIAGSDPSSGSGIQGDVRTISAFGCHPLTAITAITCQNTSGFSGARAVPPEAIAGQLDSIFSDFEVAAIKIGMVLGVPAIRTIHEKVRGFAGPIIVDPVVRSTTGGELLERGAITQYKKFIIPLGTIMTPNMHELQAVSGRRVRGRGDILPAVRVLRKMGASDIVVTGVSEGANILDCAFLGDVQHVLCGRRIAGESRGGGCSYSAALAASLGRGDDTLASIRAAKKFAAESIMRPGRPGRGLAVAGTRPDAGRARLQGAIHSIISHSKMWRHIPECQTNFVFAGPGARTIRDVLGIDGRIVRRRGGVVLAGEIAPGGSAHVAAAVLEAGKKFPQVRSGINIRYDPATIRKMRDAGMSVGSYDRDAEPESARRREGASIPWGIRAAMRGATEPPDAIFHTGGHGKEPMIVVFGSDPEDVAEKILQMI